MTWVVPDFETRSLCDLKKAGADRYAEDFSTEIITLWWEFEDGRRQCWHPGDPLHPDLLAAINDPTCFFVAHNARFEKAIWREIMVKQFGWPPIPRSRWHDTMAIAAMRQMPQKLDRLLSVLKLPAQKDNEGSRLTIALSRTDKNGNLPIITPEKLARVDQYCRSDIVGQSALHRRMGWMPPEERRVWLMDQKINDRGLALDVPLVRQMKKIVDEGSAPLKLEFEALTGGLKMTQVQAIGKWLLGQGVVMPNLAKDTLAAVLGETDEGEEVDEDDRLDLDLPPAARRALRIRQLIGSASIKKLDAMEACVCSDGRAHGLLQYHGAGPGRWAGRIIQPQNFPRGTLGVKEKDIPTLVSALMTGDYRWVADLYGPPVEAVVSSLRYALVPGKGRYFVAGDYAGIEARVVLALAGQYDKCDLLASGADVYCDMASQIYGRPINKEDDPEERQTGKNSVLGLGFQMGAKKFHGRYCGGQDLDFAQVVVDTYRKKWAPLVPAVWNELHDALIRTIWDGTPHEAYGVTYALEDAWVTARLPSDRKLWYYNPMKTRRAMPWDETDVRRGTSYQAQKMGKWLTIDTFGGLMTENVVQGLARDLLVHAMFACERENLPIVLTVHDEIVCEPLESQSDAEKMLDQLMTDIPDWARFMKIPVATETWAGDRYRK